MAKPISDEELLHRQFRYDNPESIAGLSRERPDPGLEPEIIGYYRVRPSGGRSANPNAPYVWCCHCQKRTHWDGRVVRDNTGGVYIIGGDCGRAHYGDRFVAVDRAFDEQLARQRLLDRWSRVRGLRDGMLSELDRVLQDPLWRAVDLKRQEVRRVMPDLVFRLTPIVKRGGDLIVREVVRDTAEEERRQISYERAKAHYRSLSKLEQAQARRDGLAPERDESPIYRDVQENLGPVRGKHVLTDDGDVRTHAVRLKTLLAGMAPLDGLQGLRNQQLSGTLTAVRDAGEGLRDALRETSSAWRFFEPDNLAKVQRWYASVRRAPFIRLEEVLTPREVSVSSAVTPLERGIYFYPAALEALLDPEAAER